MSSASTIRCRCSLAGARRRWTPWWRAAGSAPCRPAWTRPSGTGAWCSRSADRICATRSRPSSCTTGTSATRRTSPGRRRSVPARRLRRTRAARPRAGGRRAAPRQRRGDLVGAARARARAVRRPLRTHVERLGARRRVRVAGYVLPRRACCCATGWPTSVHCAWTTCPGRTGRSAWSATGLAGLHERPEPDECPPRPTR